MGVGGCGWVWVGVGGCGCGWVWEWVGRWVLNTVDRFFFRFKSWRFNVLLHAYPSSSFESFMIAH